MKKRTILIILCALVAAFTFVFGLTACKNDNLPQGDTGDNGNTQQPENPDKPDKPDNPDNPDNPPVTEQKRKADVFLFIGQSNMAGRGDALSATVVEEGHAYEFRAISDPTKLYPLREPFGENENNKTSGVSENLKTGSLVSAFCESYYEKTQNPVIAVSCSKGGEKISFFDTHTAVYADAVARLNAAKTYISSGAEENMELGRTFVVWLQGESDGDAGVSANDYTAALDRIVKGFKADTNAEQTLIIPIGGYNNSDRGIKAKYNVIRNAQIEYGAESANATVISTNLFDLYTYGYMKDYFHYTQEGYEIVGKDAGANAAYFASTGNKPECKAFFKEGAKTKDSGAWQEQDGRVVINASAALEQSRYASYTSNGSQGKVLYTWEKYSGAVDGIAQTPNQGGEWNINYAFSKAPQVHYTFNLTEDGRYYLYFFTSHPDTGSNSVYASIDDGELIMCNTTGYGRTKWLSDSGWYFDIPQSGEHSISVYAREDGIVLNQVVLSKDADERFTEGQALAVSPRSPYTVSGVYEETDGAVNINLSDAFENSAYAYNSSGTSLSSPDVFKWERSAGYDGVQVMPNNGVQWSTGNITPKLSYRVDFSAAGDYYAMLYTSYPDTGSDSVFLSIDDGPLLNCASYIATGVGKWTAHESWKLNVPYAGVHTVNVYAREDGAVLHRLRLTKEKPAFKTLFIGDSYTSKIAWRNFDRLTADLDAESIGIGGTKVNLWQTYADDVAFFNPEKLVIHIGVNDIDGGTSGTACGNSIIQLIKTLKTKLPNTPIFYVSICDNEMYAPGNPSGNPVKWEEYAASNALVKEFAAQTEGVYFIDFAAEMKEKGPSMQTQFRDRLHLSDEGYVLFTDVIRKFFAALGM